MMNARAPISVSLCATLLALATAAAAQPQRAGLSQAQAAAQTAGAVFQAVGGYCAREVPALRADFEQAIGAIAQRFQAAIRAELGATPEGAAAATDADYARLQSSVDRANLAAEQAAQQNSARLPAYCGEVLTRMNSLSLEQARAMLKSVYQHKTAKP